jgi:hypothetical protein
MKKKLFENVYFKLGVDLISGINLPEKVENVKFVNCDFHPNTFDIKFLYCEFEGCNINPYDLKNANHCSFLNDD